jgi:phosphoglycolate phosphatase
VNIVCDLDGTLMDPREGFVASLTYALETLGSSVYTDDELQRHVGPPLEETLTLLLGNDPERVTRAVALYRERYGKQGWLETAVYPGIRSALTNLQEAGATLFVATSKPHVFADRILSHFGLQRFFRAIYGSEFDGTNANKGQLIAHLLKTESLSPQMTVMVGDRAHDVIGALTNGVIPIGALWGYSSRQELTAAGAAIVCEHPGFLARSCPPGKSQHNLTSVLR